MIKVIIKIVAWFILTIGILFPLSCFVFSFLWCGFLSFVHNSTLFVNEISVFRYLSPSYEFFTEHRVLNLFVWVCLCVGYSFLFYLGARDLIDNERRYKAWKKRKIDDDFKY